EEICTLLCSRGFRLLFLRNVLFQFLSLAVLNTLAILGEQDFLVMKIFILRTLYVFKEPCEAQTLTSQEGLQTPN
ncbi:hypothetical protein HN51_046086, partial [Arachis hypogaea]